MESDGKQYVRGPPNLDTLQKHGGGNVMIWNSFSWHGIEPLLKIISTMDSFMYRNIMRDVKEL